MECGVCPTGGRKNPATPHEFVTKKQLTLRPTGCRQSRRLDKKEMAPSAGGSLPVRPKPRRTAPKKGGKNRRTANAYRENKKRTMGEKRESTTGLGKVAEESALGEEFRSKTHGGRAVQGKATTRGRKGSKGKKERNGKLRKNGHRHCSRRQGDKTRRARRKDSRTKYTEHDSG